MRVDHIGYAVKDISNARKTMEALGYVFEPIVEDTERNISIAFGNLDGYRVELVSPNRGGYKSGRYCYFKEQCDAIPHMLQEQKHRRRY